MFILYSLFFIVSLLSAVNSVGIFHEKSKTVFTPSREAGFFGYSLVLGHELVVGAPRTKYISNPSVTSGALFGCKSSSFTTNHSSCQDINFDATSRRRLRRTSFFRDDMWFGATVAVLPNNVYVVCAPRASTPYNDRFLLMNGGCIIGKKSGERSDTVILQPFDARVNQAFVTDGHRKEYGVRGTYVNYYAYAQAGMSLKVDGDQLILGAPGVLQWTGAFAKYQNIKDMNQHYFMDPTKNPYFSEELGPDEYFGYSLESGIFDQSSGETYYVVGAPRSDHGNGQVFIFRDTASLNKIDVVMKIQGPHLGSYFGAALLVVDFNGDDQLDLLVGTPNYVASERDPFFDQGAVFVYENYQMMTEFTLQTVLTGEGHSGSRFGTSIANLGDINGDGYNDIAVGAPWESNGKLGAVYIYTGGPTGISNKYAQKITAEGSNSFGWSISKGYDVDYNKCNDIAIGAPNSNEVYLFRCIPTVDIVAVIDIPNALDLPANATNFTAEFKVESAVTQPNFNPQASVYLKAIITLDSENNAASLAGDSEYDVRLNAPGDMQSHQVVIDVKHSANLSKPITLHLKLEEQSDDSPEFPQAIGRVSERSQLYYKYDLQLTRDCGNDFVCTPLLSLDIKGDSHFIPGLHSNIIEVDVIVRNDNEPAFDTRVHITLPLLPKRVPSGCALREFTMTCSIQTLKRKEIVTWSIVLDYNLRNNKKHDLVITADLKQENAETKLIKKNWTIVVEPTATFEVKGISLPNITIPVTRERLYNKENISFIHTFEIVNFGPSDWYFLATQTFLPEMANLTNTVKYDCDVLTMECKFHLKANTSTHVTLNMNFDLGVYGEYLLEHTTVNLTSEVLLSEHNISASVTTVLILNPAPPYWPLIVGAVAGIILLSIIIIILYKRGFFHRLTHAEMQKLQEDTPSAEMEATGSSEKSPEDYESSKELLDSSDEEL